MKAPREWEGPLRTYFANPNERPLLVWGHHLLSSEAVKALHAFGYNVLETWPGDTLTSHESGTGAAANAHAVRLLLKASNQRTLHSTQRTVLLISDVDCICHTGRSALAEAYKTSKKRKKGDSAPAKSSVPLVVCTCSDYYAASMRTVMHKLVPVGKSVRMSKASTLQERLSVTPWDAVLAVRRRPICPKTDVERMRADEADQYMRSMPCVMATLHESVYTLSCRAERPMETRTKYTDLPKKQAEALRDLDRMCNVADHLSDCDLLTPLVERKRKLHADDDDPTFAVRDGQEAKTAALTIGLSLQNPLRAPSTLKTVLFPPHAAPVRATSRALDHHAVLASSNIPNT